MFDMDNAVDEQRIDESIELLKQHIGGDEIAPLISALQKLSDNPYSQPYLDQLSEVFEGLGFMQGTVLTYAPYISIILQNDPFDGVDPFPEDEEPV